MMSQNWHEPLNYVLVKIIASITIYQTMILFLRGRNGLPLGMRSVDVFKASVQWCDVSICLQCFIINTHSQHVQLSLRNLKYLTHFNINPNPYNIKMH